MLGESYLIIPSGSLTDSSCQARRKRSVPGSSSRCPQSTTAHSHPHGICFLLSVPQHPPPPPPLSTLVATDTSPQTEWGQEGPEGQRVISLHPAPSTFLSVSEISGFADILFQVLFTADSWMDSISSLSVCVSLTSMSPEPENQAAIRSSPTLSSLMSAWIL